MPKVEKANLPYMINKKIFKSSQGHNMTIAHKSWCMLFLNRKNLAAKLLSANQLWANAKTICTT